MGFWKSEDAEKRFGEVMRRALTSTPQTVVGPGPSAVVVMSEAEYQRLRKDSHTRGASAVRGFGGQELFEIMQNSPLAAAIRDGDIPENWLERTRESWDCPRRAGVLAADSDAAD